MSRKLSDAKYRALVTEFVARQHAARPAYEAARNARMESGELRKPDGKRYVLTSDPVAAKCINPATGLPVTGRGKANAVFPVMGSEMTLGDGSVTGTCPLCGAHVKVSSVSGGVGAHTVRREPLPKSGALSEPNVAPVDTGARTGDPESGGKRRMADIDGAYERGVVPAYDPETLKPVKEDGEHVEVPATYENVGVALRAALAAGKRLCQRKNETDADFRARTRENADLVARYRRMQEAYRRGTDAMMAGCSPEGTESCTTADDGRVVKSGRVMSPGPAVSQGKDTPPMAGDVVVWRKGEERPDVPEATDTRKGWQRSAGTMAEPLGRPRIDKGAGTVEKHGGEFGWLTHEEYWTLSRGQQNRYWKTLNKRKAEAREARKRLAAWRAKGPQRAGTGTGGVGSRTFVHDGYDRDGYRGAASVTERLMQQPPRG